jgi:translation initiation factor IF-3
MRRRLESRIVKQLRVNERIFAKEVRLVGEKGEQLGVMPIAQAKELARKANLDIVEVAPTSVPPVCRLLDYGKFKYEQRKKEQQAKKNQKVTILREIRLRPKIGAHDFDFKARTAKKLLDDGAKVKVTLMFRGREITHPELGWKILQRMADTLSEVGTLERQPMMEGRRMDIIIAPAATKTKAKAETETKTEAKTKEKPEVKAEAKTETKAETKTKVKTAGKEKVAVKTGTKETQNAKT